MKSAIKMGLFLSALIISQDGFTQVKSSNHSVKNTTMEVAISTNKGVIHSLYESIMNNRKFDLLSSIVSEDYTNAQGEKGIEAFKHGIMAVINAFPDAKWILTEIIAEGNKVFVRQQVQGTHKGVFQNISPTNRAISNDGMVIYKFENGKIISYQIQTDRLGFLQQLGILPSDPISLIQGNESNVFFVDKFIVPKNAIVEFTERMQYNRNFIKSIPGFIKDEVIAYEDANGDITLMTIAVWQNQGFFNKAKQLVEAEYKKINFNPAEFTERLNIKMDREVYKAYQK
ncbi:ester cyclase [Galbibacter sp.]|uniref:ester cyclase n=1 Tax=Galbibacter sp. TaxID=2918471 RepID=UPI003A8E46C1